jgi:diadenosine tetraphosphate (Ap4A) HIT family hydrolase
MTSIGAAEQSCVFCLRAEREAVHTHELALVLPDTYPLTQGHSLVIPRRHVASFFELTAAERVAMLGLLDRAKEDLDKLYRPDGYNIGINDGAAAGQTVMHVHMHLIPRYAADTSDPRGGVRWIFPDRAAYWKQK